MSFPRNTISSHTHTSHKIYYSLCIVTVAAFIFNQIDHRRDFQKTQNTFTFDLETTCLSVIVFVIVQKNTKIDSGNSLTTYNRYKISNNFLFRPKFLTHCSRKKSKATEICSGSSLSPLTTGHVTIFVRHNIHPTFFFPLVYLL